MLDIKFLRQNPDIVKENIKKKFQDEKLPMVDEVIDYDKQQRECQQRSDYLRSQQYFQGNRRSYGSGEKGRGRSRKEKSK